MIKKTPLIILVILFYTATFAQKRIGNETPEAKKKRMEWWTDSRFGMFIHWGLYSMPARHEWVKNAERLNNEDYEKYFKYFDPDLFQPKIWAKKAKAAGMKYAVMTSKHHEGFTLFDSQYTDYKATNTPAKRDLVKEYIDAFRAEGLKVGLYYSLIDWHHPDFTIDKHHPQRALNKANELDSYYDGANKGKDFSKYRAYLFNQVKEILTKYGKIDVLWLDFSYPGKFGKDKNDWGSIELIKMIRKLQPGIIINDRLDISDYEDGKDFVSPEQVSTKELEKYRGKLWETCQTFSGSWGYYRDETTWKTNRQLLDLLITSVANGGNILLNVGPTARGDFDDRANKALDSLGIWMSHNNKSIYNCTYAPTDYEVMNGTKLTYNDKTKRLYVHLFDYPADGRLLLKNYRKKVDYAQFLHDNSELIIDKEASNVNDLVLKLPKQKPNYEIPVIELILK
jgi:alpha-L-fucosidase